jgi:hypothetical protein
MVQDSPRGSFSFSHWFVVWPDWVIHGCPMGSMSSALVTGNSWLEAPSTSAVGASSSPRSFSSKTPM